MSYFQLLISISARFKKKGRGGGIMRQKLIRTSGNWDGNKDEGEGKELTQLHKYNLLEAVS